MSCADRPRCRNLIGPEKTECGNEVRYPNEDRCEDCYADAQVRWTGKSQRVNTNVRPEVTQ